MPKLAPVTDARQSVTATDKTSDREMLCWAISELERMEKEKNRVNVSCTPNLPLQNRLIKLIGRKPLFNCKLNDVSSKVLWDTGSMPSMVSSSWVKDNIPNAKLQPISDFLENDEKLEFKAANNTDVPMEGCVVLVFSMGKSSFEVPFLVTSSTLSNPIVGFNVMEHLIISGKETREEVINSLSKANNTVTAEKFDVMVTLVEENFAEDDFLGDLRATKAHVVPANSSIRIRCKVKGDVKGLDVSFMCSAPVAGD